MINRFATFFLNLILTFFFFKSFLKMKDFSPAIPVYLDTHGVLEELQQMILISEPKIIVNSDNPVRYNIIFNFFFKNPQIYLLFFF